MLFDGAKLAALYLIRSESVPMAISQMNERKRDSFQAFDYTPSAYGVNSESNEGKKEKER